MQIPSRLTVLLQGLRNQASTEPYSRQQRLTALLMLVLTAIYLTIELAFNARLLDVVGSLEGGDTIEELEKYGRLISGTAVALLILGKILGNAAKKGKGFWAYVGSTFWIVLLCGSAMVGVYFGQKKLVDTLVEHSSNEDRRRAAVLVPMSKLIKTGVVGVPTLTLEVKDYEEPAGKTFLATLPLQTIAHPTLFTNLEGSVPKMFRAFSEQERKYADGFYTIYKESIESLKKQYNGEYRSATQSYQSEFGPKLFIRQNDAWRDYANRLQQQRRNLRPDNVPPAYWGRVRNDVRAQGVMVPDNWNPADRATFNVAVERRVREEALSKFRSESKAKLHLSSPLDPGLDFDSFMRSEGVLGKWKQMLKVPGPVALRMGIGPEQFSKEIYAPSVEADVKDLMTRNYAPADLYGKNRRFQKTGEDAYRALIVPPIALVFSLMGAMTHIFKVLMFIAKVFFYVPALLYWSAFAVYMSLVALVPLAFSNNVTNQTLFHKLEKYTVEGGSFFVAKGIRWVTQFQPFFYPVNDFVSKQLGQPQFDRRIEFLEKLDRHTAH